MKKLTLLYIGAAALGAVILNVVELDDNNQDLLTNHSTSDSFEANNTDEVNETMRVAAPMCPVMISPAEGATEIPTEGGTYISFITSGASNPGNYWRVYYGTDPNNLINGGGYPVGGNGYVGTAIMLQPNTLYYWVVTETNLVGQTSQCDLQSFHTSSFCPTHELQVGEACDDNDEFTINDVILTDCSCIGASIDLDNDFVADNIDNCVEEYNPLQLDMDGDGIGNLCDNDIDGDGEINISDCDPNDENVFFGADCDDEDENTINDAISVSCECVGSSGDSDFDGISDEEDNCPFIPNASQDDYDQDGLGDSCDNDMDGDGFINIEDCDPEDENYYLGAPCDDEDENTWHDAINEICECAGTTVYDCELLSLNFGDACDDGNSITINDVINSSCVCEGVGALNDVCVDAEVVACGQIVSGTTLFTNADSSLTDCHELVHLGPGVWYRLLGAGQTINVSTFASDYDTQIAVFGGGCHALECIVSNDDINPNSFESGVDFYAGSGLDYYIYVTGYSTLAGNFNLFVECYETAENAHCNLATVINEGEVMEAKISGGHGAVGLCFAGAQNSIWYKYVATETGTCTIQSDSSIPNVDTRLSVYEGNCESLICLASNDDVGNNNYSSRVAIEVTVGDEFYIEWDDIWSNDYFNFNVSIISYDCNELQANFEEECDDGDLTTINDMITENCTCEGVLTCNAMDKNVLEICYNEWGAENTLLNWNFDNNDPVTNGWTGVTIHPISGCVDKLILGDKNLVGSLPEDLGDLKAIREMKIAANTELTGPIPESLGDLYRLHHLELQDNNLTGLLPRSLGGLWYNLYSLDLRNNSLVGCVPITYYNFCGLTAVFLEGNPELDTSDMSSFCYLGTGECRPPEGSTSDLNKNGTFESNLEIDAIESSYVIYPNPNDGTEINIAPEGHKDWPKSGLVYVLDSYGKQVFRTAWNDQTSPVFKVSLDRKLASGMYLVVIETNVNRETNKIIIR